MADVSPNVETVRVPNPLTDSLTTARSIQDALGKLPKADADQIRSLLRGNATDEQKEALARLTGLENFKNAKGDTMVAVLTQLANELRDPRQSGLNWVLKEPNFARLDAKQQVAALELLGATVGTPAFGEKLAKLISANGPDGNPLLLSTDSKGKTVLENLTTLARAKFHSDVTAAGITPTKVIGDLVYEIFNPAHFVDQGNRGACAAAAMQDLLCRTQPAEYLRLVTGLFVNKSVATRDGTLSIADGSLVAAKDPALGQPDLRSHGERIFQSSLLARVSTMGEYSYKDDSTTLTLPKSLFGNTASSLLPSGLNLGGGGMSNSEMTRAMNELFGKDSHRFVSGSGSTIHGALRARGEPAVICMNWDGGKHALLFVKSDDTHVYLKDPNGGGPETEGNRVTREMARSTPGANIRMTVKEFEAHLTHAHIRSSGTTPAPDRSLLTPSLTLGTVQTGVDIGIGTINEANRRFGSLVMPLAPAAAAGAGALADRIFGPRNR